MNVKSVMEQVKSPVQFVTVTEPYLLVRDGKIVRTVQEMGVPTAILNAIAVKAEDIFEHVPFLMQEYD